MEQELKIITPPADLPQIQRGNWFDVPAGDPVASYLAFQYNDQIRENPTWQAARLSNAAYLYREIHSEWKVVAKFYGVKSPEQGREHGIQEYELNKLAHDVYLLDDRYRAVRPLELWQDVLLLEYVDGLTLEDTIAVRKSQPGVLVDCIEHVAGLIANLHTAPTGMGKHMHFRYWIHKTYKIIETLSKHGVLIDDLVTQQGLTRLIERWEGSAQMLDYGLVPLHGDATTSNFVFPKDGGIVAIDWERSACGDPASDLGRLLAEISYSINNHGGDQAEAQAFTSLLLDSYCAVIPPAWDVGALLNRTRFFQASSSLRIARNGWVTRKSRLHLVTQAFALLN